MILGEVLSVDIGHHMLDTGVILKAIAGEVFAVAAALISTMRHLSDKRNMRIDPDATEVEGLCHSHRSAVVLGPDR